APTRPRPGREAAGTRPTRPGRRPPPDGTPRSCEQALDGRRQLARRRRRQCAVDLMHDPTVSVDEKRLRNLVEIEAQRCKERVRLRPFRHDERGPTEPVPRREVLDVLAD
ncbi:MAG: hypothetical protein ACK56F_03235, partial [bacterium]